MPGFRSRKKREQVQEDLGQASGKDAKNPIPAGGDTLIYATSDVHGYPLDSFLRLLEKAGFGDEDTLYVLGDVIDRNGDGGVAMLRWMMDRPNVEFLLGNHEEMLLSCSFLFDEITDESIGHLDYGQMHLLLQWMRNGAQPTMTALRGLKKKDPEAATDLLDYLRDAPLYATASAGGKDYLLVHSGLEHFSPERKLSEYTPDELLWNRPSPDDRYFPDITTILGHTPTGYLFGEKGKMFRTDTWIDIDTGASGGGSPMLLRLDDLKAFYSE
jgi:serine/threonine protein phosphatase 1